MFVGFYGGNHLQTGGFSWEHHLVFQVVAGRVGDSFIWVIFYLIEFLELLVTMLLVSRRNQ